MNLKKIISMIIISFCIMFIGYFLIVLVYLLPECFLHDDVNDSAEILMSQGTYPNGFLDGWFLDNYTDADCISIAYNKESNNPLENALNAFELSGDEGGGRSIEALNAMVKGNIARRSDHSYLWHGYRIWLRPLLVKYNITEIRYFCYIVTIFLSTIVCIELIRNTNNLFTFIPFLISLCFFNFQMESLSLLFFNDIAISLLGCILIIICMRKKSRYFEEIFTGIGSIIAFSSMLIMPILTVGFPLIVWMVLDEHNSEWKRKSILTVKYSVCWFIGYAFTMMTKVYLSLKFVHSSAGFKQISSWIGKTDHYSMKDRINTVFITFWDVVQRSEIERDIMLVIFIVLIAHAFFKKGKLKTIYIYFPYFIVALYPCVWCFVNARHAGHKWTYFNYSISIYALLCVLFKLCELERDLFKKGCD